MNSRDEHKEWVRRHSGGMKVDHRKRTFDAHESHHIINAALMGHAQALGFLLEELERVEQPSELVKERIEIVKELLDEMREEIETRKMNVETSTEVLYLKAGHGRE